MNSKGQIIASLAQGRFSFDEAAFFFFGLAIIRLENLDQCSLTSCSQLFQIHGLLLAA
jgi:hypothetical protein